MRDGSCAPRIKVLDPDIANKIAAGEVVERPASVLKELLENSIDAKASKIDVSVAQGGIENITVIDNGCGILGADLRLALQQHATSKIQDEQDLNYISSLGFRGEALASISSVAKLTITSHTTQQQHAWALAGNILTPAAHPVGTTIQMHDLFYNVPARRKFLRSARTEYIYLEEVFRRIALSHFNIAFTLTHNKKLVKTLPACLEQNTSHKRLIALCGKQLVQNSITVDATQNGMRLWGWLGLPETARSQEPHQYFYINQRIIKDRLINHAIRQVYQPLCMEGKMPFYCLYLELDPVALDVNVHPTKHEVRFREARVIHSFIMQVLNDALRVPKIQTQNVMQYKNLEHMYNIDVQTPLVEFILDQKIIIARRGSELIMLDVQRAQQQLLLQELQKCEIEKLVVPIPINIKLNSQVAFLNWCQEFGIGLDVLVEKIIIRTLPKSIAQHKCNFPRLLTMLHEMWSKSTPKPVVQSMLVHQVEFACLSKQEAQNLLIQALKLEESNIYRVLNASMLSSLLLEKQSKSLPKSDIGQLTSNLS